MDVYSQFKLLESTLSTFTLTTCLLSTKQTYPREEPLSCSLFSQAASKRPQAFPHFSLLCICPEVAPCSRQSVWRSLVCLRESSKGFGSRCCEETESFQFSADGETILMSFNSVFDFTQCGFLIVMKFNP